MKNGASAVLHKPLTIAGMQACVANYRNPQPYSTSSSSSTSSHHVTHPYSMSRNIVESHKEEVEHEADEKTGMLQGDDGERNNVISLPV